MPQVQPIQTSPAPCLIAAGTGSFGVNILGAVRPTNEDLAKGPGQ